MASERRLSARARRAARVVAALLALLGLPLLAACERGDAPESEPAAAASAAPELPRSVRVVPVGTGDLVAQRSVSASVAAAKESRVAAGASGRVARVVARPGSAVAAGEPVVLLDDDQLRGQAGNAGLAVETARVNLESARRGSAESLTQLQAQVRSAEANARVAEERYAEAQRLLEVGGVARADVSAAEAQVEQARSALIAARDALARAERASQEDLRLLELQLQQARNSAAQARDALAEAQVVAPFAGEVAEIFVEEGEFVGAGSPVFRLVTLDERVATVTLPPEDAAELQERGEVFFRYAGLDYGARVLRVERRAQQPRQVTLVAELYGAANPIPTGGVAELRYEVALGRGVRVPSGALAAEGGQTWVFVVEDENGETRTRRTPVRVVAEAGSSAVVEGLPAGSLVVSPRPLDVRDGTLVRIGERGPASGELPSGAEPPDAGESAETGAANGAGEAAGGE